MSGRGPSDKGSVQAVIFDLDGVLVSSAEAHCEAYRRTFASQGVEFTSEDYRRLGLAAPRDVVIGRVLGEIPASTLESLMKTKERHLEDVLREGGVRPIPGAVDFLRAVRKRGLKTAVATSGRAPRLLLEAAGIQEPFDAIVDRGHVKRPKPSPDIYEVAAGRLGVEPGNCLAIEDSPPGVEAAAASGMRVLALTTTHPAVELKRADAVLGGFEDIDLKSWLG